MSYGSVGVVALALSILFEMLAHHQTTGLGSKSPEARSQPPDPIHRMFGADAGSDISSIASEFLKQVAGFYMQCSKHNNNNCVIQAHS